MSKRIALTAALTAALAAIAVLALPATGHRPAQAKHLIAAMSGQEESPLGDPNGYGAARFEVLGRNVCFRIVAKQIEPTLVGHIHRGDPGAVGPPVVTLYTGDVPTRKRCVKATRALAREIARFPARFYVNVHTQTFPDGAIRGQLTR